MLADIISALWGPLGGVLGGLGALVVALVLGRWQGGKQAQAKRDAQDGKDYIAERRRQDGKDVGLGATDDERLRMLKRIRDRNGAGKG